ncbi:YGGT family-domain-containing protein [Dunaliella salina]|uniref:YGGT family-domain-containing protein n=1 Tax=Dunaliella salina TaxID=3046 RepID=A0ABQ7GVY5_DUNSA|nr:YGGT family-domain-containing protein [Dunaliella salina]|eukprot:KAF5838720.1 YGGT family-domain-containing protein [Dunaliella salina]
MAMSICSRSFLQSSSATSRRVPCPQAKHGPLQPSAPCASNTASSQAQPPLIDACLLARVGTAWKAARELPAPATPKDLRAQMTSAGRSCMAVALPFASSVISSGSGANSMGEVYFALSKAIDIYMMVLTVRVLMTWFRGINWLSEPARTLRQFTDPPLNACRGIIPAIGGIDLSPMLLFFGLSFLSKQLKILALGA